MAKTMLLKMLKHICKTETEYNNIISNGLLFFEKIHDHNIETMMPACTVKSFFVELINEKVKQVRRIKREQPERAKECSNYERDLINTKYRITGNARVQ